MSAEKELARELLDSLEHFFMRHRVFFRMSERNIMRRSMRKLRSVGKLSPKEGERLLVALKRASSRAHIPSPTATVFRMIKRLSAEGVDVLFNSFKKELIKRMRELKEKKEKVKIVFMFGSGASRPPPSNIPTVNEMLDYLVGNLPPTEIPFASKVKDWASRNGINIEDILTVGYLGTLLVSKPIVNKLVGEIIYRELEDEAELREREYVFSFQDLVGRVFSMVSGLMAKADSNIVHESVANLIKNSQNDELLEFSVTTTNYDVCVEKAFEKSDLKYRYLGIDGKEGIPLVKIHGSINWFYCEGCQSVVTYSIKELERFKKIFPTSGSCQKCGTPASLLMVPPIAYKYVMFPILIDIWQAAMRTIEEADIIVVIGYSFGLADDYIFKMVVSSIKKKSSTLVLLDKEFSSIENLKNKLLAYHLKLPYPIIGDAEETVPVMVKAIKEAKTSVAKETREPKKTKKRKK